MAKYSLTGFFNISPKDIFVVKKSLEYSGLVSLLKDGYQGIVVKMNVISFYTAEAMA